MITQEDKDLIQSLADKDYKYGKDGIIELLTELCEIKNKQINKWIKVEYELPSIGASFLYLTVNRKVMVCVNRSLDSWFINKYGVTHWMYVPELPE